MEKHILFICLFSFLILNYSYSQGSLEIIKTFNQNETYGYEAWGVDVDEDGFVYWPVNVDSMNTGFDIVCYKYDENGSEQWNSPLIVSGQGTQQSYVINHYQGNVYIGGRTCNGLVITCDMLMAKANASSAELYWDESYNFPSNGYDEVDGLEIYNDTIYCGGWAQSLETGIYNSDIGFWTLNQDGETIWTNEFGQEGSAEHQDGHFVVDEEFIYAAGLWNGTGIANLHNGYSFLGKFSRKDGSIVDSVLFGNQTNAFLDIENALGMTSDGTHLYVTGYTSPNAVNDWQIYVAKFNKDLELDWYTLWGAEEAESARAIAVQDELLFIGGVTGSPSLSIGGQDAVFLVMNKNNGNVLDEFIWGDEFDNSIRDIATDGKNVYLSGTSSDIPNRSSAFLAKYQIVSSVIDKLENQLVTTAFPNPFSGSIKINSTEKIRAVNIYNTTGQLVYKTLSKDHESRLEIEVNHLINGIYFAQIVYDDFTEIIKLKKI